MTGDSAGQVMGRARGDGGRGVSCLLEYRLRTHLGKLNEGSVVYNMAWMGACSWRQGTAQAR